MTTIDSLDLFFGSPLCCPGYSLLFVSDFSSSLYCAFLLLFVDCFFFCFQGVGACSLLERMFAALDFGFSSFPRLLANLFGSFLSLRFLSFAFRFSFCLSPIMLRYCLSSFLFFFFFFL